MFPVRHDVILVKLLESQAEHLLCTTSVRVNRLKELSARKYKAGDYQQSRREALRELDIQHDYEEKPKAKAMDQSHYYTHPVSVSVIECYLFWHNIWIEVFAHKSCCQSYYLVILEVDLSNIVFHRLHLSSALSFLWSVRWDRKSVV